MTNHTTAAAVAHTPAPAPAVIMSTICFTAWVYPGTDPRVLANIAPWVSSGNLSAHPSVNCYATAPSTGAVLCDVSVNVLRPDLAINVAGTLGRNTSGGVGIAGPRLCYSGPPLNATYYARYWLACKTRQNGRRAVKPT